MSRTSDDITKQFAAKLAHDKEAMIRDNLPAGFNVADVTCEIMPSGVEIYSHRGVPVLEIYPPTFTDSMEDNSYKMTASWNYRKIVGT